MSLALVLGVVIGLASVFLALSLVATWLQELIAAALKWRSRHLAAAIRQLLDQPAGSRVDAAKELGRAWSADAGESVRGRVRESLFKALYEHPFVSALREARSLPSYIPARDFSAAIVDLLVKAGSEESPAAAAIDSLKTGIRHVRGDQTRAALLAVVGAVEMTESRIEARVARIRDSLAVWFDSVMDRASGWYRRRAQVVAVVIGFGLAIVFNVDAIRVTRALWRDSLLAEAVRIEVERGGAVAFDRLAEIGLPIGWERGNVPQGAAAIALWALGIAVAGFAVSQGSPFWFDVLNRVTNIRLSGRRPEPAEPAVP